MPISPSSPCQNNSLPQRPSPLKAGCFESSLARSHSQQPVPARSTRTPSATSTSVTRTPRSEVGITSVTRTPHSEVGITSVTRTPRSEVGITSVTRTPHSEVGITSVTGTPRSEVGMCIFLC